MSQSFPIPYRFLGGQKELKKDMTAFSKGSRQCTGIKYRGKFALSGECGMPMKQAGMVEIAGHEYRFGAVPTGAT